LIRELIDSSTSPLDKEKGGTLKNRYVCAVVMEFINQLFVNGIPLQPQLQTVVLGFLFEAKEYCVLQQLLQFSVLDETYELARVLIQLGSKSNIDSDSYFEPALNLGLDMMLRLKLHSEIVSTLIAEDYVMRALDHAQAYDVIGLRYKALIENVDSARAQGDDIKASILSKRLSKMKEVSFSAV